LNLPRRKSKSGPQEASSSSSSIPSASGESKLPITLAKATRDLMKKVTEPKTPPRTAATPRASPFKAKLTAEQCIPVDTLGPPEGPITVVIRARREKDKNRIHFFTPFGAGLGCGWTPPNERVVNLLKEDYRGHEDEYMECGPCFASHTFPKSWNDEGPMRHPDLGASDSEVSLSDNSDSDDEVDTASETEATPMSSLVGSDKIVAPQKESSEAHPGIPKSGTPTLMDS
jgi:hypothetical protein